MPESATGKRACLVRPWIGRILGPCVMLGLLLASRPEGLPAEGLAVAAVAALMAIWWICEAMPVAATALLPIPLFPLLGIMDGPQVTSNYGNHLIFLFLGGFWIAVTMEKWQLHRRLALHIIRRVGGQAHRVVLGFMLATAFLSMWLSNTATAMMMLPIAMAVAGRADEGDAQASNGVPNSPFATALMLGIAYAASIGGVATLIGTPPNAILAGVSETFVGQRIGFGTWLAFGLPLSALMLLLTWWYLTRVAFGAIELPPAGGGDPVRRELEALGGITREERWVLAVFAAVAVAWILRGLTDWGPLTRIGDSGIALVGALSLFLIPVSGRSGEFLLDWKRALGIPWGVILLFGGGFALAKGFETSGLALWIGERLVFTQGMPGILLVLLVTLVTIFLTEITSNTATASMLLPIGASLANAAGLDPLSVMAATALAASFAFMLPVATPPNAIVYASGRVGIPQMARVGFWLNLLGVVLITAAVSWLLPWVFGR